MSKMSLLAASLLVAATPIAGNVLQSAAAADLDPAALQTVAPTTISCAGQPQTTFAQAQGIANPPLCSGGAWIYDIPASTSPSATRRTESHWGSANTTKSYKAGDTVTYEAEYAGYLGPAAQGDNDWHVLWQLHGPVNGQWPGPAMGIAVRNGQIRLGGGDGHAGQNYATNNYEWVAPIAQWRDGVPVRIKVQTYLSTDPQKGWVSAWVDGRQVLNRYKPVSYGSNLMPGTIYEGQSWVASRTGLYRGTQRGLPPTYRQVVTAKVYSVG